MSGNITSKTVFLLDHTHCMREASGISIEIESNGGPPLPGVRGGALNYFPSFIPPVTKNLWTILVESVLEYARVVWDLFSDERLLRFALCEGQQGQPIWLNNWEVLSNGQQQQSMAFMSEAFANAGPPTLHNKRTPSTVSVMQLAIQSAIEALASPTPAQIAFGQGGSSKSNSLKALNRGRIICITSFTSDSVGNTSAEELEDFFLKTLTQHNRVVAPASDHLLSILECEFVLISIHPKGKEHLSRVQSRPLHVVTPMLRAEVHVADCDRLHKKIVDLFVTHHDLISTTVTGIPMKEEQNAQSSSIYDVPLWHSRLPTSCEDSRVLRWASPVAPSKTVGVGCGAGGLVHHCISAVRITPVDVNSRPSTCLSGFVINGRSVWLDMPKKGKALCHMLTPHGTEMWMHVIETARNVLEDPPSISEGIGGRVTDYRIPDFAEFIKLNIVIPYPRNFQDHVLRVKPDRDGNPFIRRRSSSIEDLKKPIEMSKSRLIRKSGYWPMTISGSVLFPMAVHIEGLLSLMTHDSMTDMEKVECDKCIWSLMAVEARGDPPNPTAHHKKGQKRDEQWKAVYNDVELFLKSNQHSENHKKVLECFLESRRADFKIDSKNDEFKNNRLKDSNIDKALLEMAKLTAPKVVISDSPMSPPPVSNSKATPEVSTTSKKSLLTLWTVKTEKKDFRTLTNTKLYTHLSTTNEDRKMDTK